MKMIRETLLFASMLSPWCQNVNRLSTFCFGVYMDPETSYIFCFKYCRFFIYFKINRVFFYFFDEIYFFSL